MIVNSALGAAAKGLPNWSIYSAAKGAMLSLSRALSIELAPRGIRVNAITPGPIDTPAMEKLGLPAETLGAFKQTIASRVPLGRFGRDEEVANTVAFLASPAAGFITGANIFIDGGLAAA
ncbi:MAG: SDR family oxidoreductase [Rhodospirillales bacterium]|nr:SDR family oxidoreductase [Rhodospirillales bacterium]